MLFFLLACGDDTKDTGVSEEDAALWEEISDYSDWQQLENWTGVNASDSVHGVAMQTWYNDTAYEGLMQGEEAMPNGSIIVKEGYADTEGSDINAITVMKKIDGYNSEAGDWYWASFNVDGSVNTSGAVDMCISCHNSSQRDYLLLEPSSDSE